MHVKALCSIWSMFGVLGLYNFDQEANSTQFVSAWVGNENQNKFHVRPCHLHFFLSILNRKCWWWCLMDITSFWCKVFLCSLIRSYLPSKNIGCSTYQLWLLIHYLYYSCLIQKTLLFPIFSGLAGWAWKKRLLKIWIIDVIHMPNVPGYNVFIGVEIALTHYTLARTLSISGVKSRVLKLSFLSLKMMVKSGLEFILKLTEPLQSCCCPVKKYLPRMAELAWQLCRYLWRGSVNFKINSRPLFTII